MKENPKKWFALLDQVTVMHRKEPKMHTITEAQLEQFESLAAFALPQEYKEYCQVFGTGEFGITLFNIRCPDYLKVAEHLISLQDCINACVNYAD